MKKINTTHTIPTPKRVIKINSTYTELPTFTEAQLNEFQNSINIAFSTISKVMDEQLNELQSTMALVGETIKDFYANPRTTQAAKYIGNMGWCVDLDWEPRIIIDIYIKKLSPKELNQCMLEYYTHTVNLDNLINELLTCPKIKKWHNSLYQASKAYNNKLYIATICTLLPVYEGILFEFWDDKWQKPNKRKTDATYLAKQLLYDCSLEKNFIKYLTLLSLHQAIKKLYNGHTIQFDNPETQERYNFNRHGILHGRIPMKNNIYDALKLFNNIASLVAFL